MRSFTCRVVYLFPRVFILSRSFVAATFGFVVDKNVGVFFGFSCFSNIFNRYFNILEYSKLIPAAVLSLAFFCDEACEQGSANQAGSNPRCINDKKRYKVHNYVMVPRL